MAHVPPAICKMDIGQGLMDQDGPSFLTIPLCFCHRTGKCTGVLRDFVKLALKTLQDTPLGNQVNHGSLAVSCDV